MRKKLIYSLIMGLVFIMGSQNALGQTEYEKYVKSETPDSSILKMADEVLILEKEDAEKATKPLQKLIKKVQKKPYQMIGLSNYFLDKGSFPTAKMVAQNAYEMYPEDVNVIIQMGDIYHSIRQYGKAAQFYDEALNKDSTNLYALTMAAFLFKETNPAKCLVYLDMMKKEAPNSILVSRYLGDIYFWANDYEKALLSYENYYKITPHNIDNLNENSCINYLQLLRNNKNYAEIENLSTELFGIYPRNTYFKRSVIDAIINGKYDDMTENDANKIVELSSFVINKEFNDTSYFYDDYNYLAIAYKKLGNTDEYIKWNEKAFEKDSSAINLLLGISDAYARQENYDKAIETLKLYIEKADTIVEASDYYFLGGFYAQKALKCEGEERNLALAETEKNFNIYSEKSKESDKYIGVLQMAKVYNALQDDVNAEKKCVQAIQMMGEITDNNKQSYVDANTMLLTIETRKKDFDISTIKQYCKAILSINPEDDYAKGIDDYLKQNGY